MLEPQWGCKKLVVVGHKMRDGYLGFIGPVPDSGDWAYFEQPLAPGGFKSKKIIKRFPALERNKEWTFYIDRDGDVSRCNVRYVKAVEKAGWPSE